MKQLRKSDIRELNKKIEKFGLKLDKKTDVRIDGIRYYVNKELKFFEWNNKILPNLKELIKDENLISKFKKVQVDMGAVKFVVNGADIMRPGINKFDDNISKEEIVIIIDESHSKPIALGVAMQSSNDMKEKSTGKSIHNIHHVGDSIWKNETKA